jgi:hypothetical protein
VACGSRSDDLSIKSGEVYSTQQSREHLKPISDKAKERARRIRSAMVIMVQDP